MHAPSTLTARVVVDTGAAITAAHDIPRSTIAAGEGAPAVRTGAAAGRRGGAATVSTAAGAFAANNGATTGEA